MSLFKQNVWAIGAAVITAGSRFFVTTLLASKVGQSSFGVFVYTQWSIEIFYLVFSFGTSGAISRYVAEYQNNFHLQNKFIIAWTKYALMLVCISAITNTAYYIILNNDTKIVTIALIFIWALEVGASSLMNAINIGFQKFDLIFKVNLINSVLMVAGVLMLNDRTSDINILFFLMIFSLIFGLILNFIKIYNYINIKNNKLYTEEVVHLNYRKIWKYSINIWISTLIASLLWSRGELPIIKNILGVNAVAEYSIALSLFAGLQQAVMLGISALSPHISKMWGERSDYDVVIFAREIMNIQLLISSMLSLFAIIYSEQVVSLILPKIYENTSFLLSIFCLSLLALSTSCYSQVLQLKTDATFNRNSTVISLVLLYFLSYTLTTTFGITGSAIARFIAMVFIAVVTMFHIVKYWGISTIPIFNILFITIILSLTFFVINYIKIDIIQKSILFLTLIFILIYNIKDINGNKVLFIIINKFKKIKYENH